MFCYYLPIELYARLYVGRQDLTRTDLTHWLCDYPVGDVIRQRVFGCHKWSSEWLGTPPGDMMAYAKTLVNLDA